MCICISVCDKSAIVIKVSGDQRLWVSCQSEQLFQTAPTLAQKRMQLTLSINRMNNRPFGRALQMLSGPYRSRGFLHRRQNKCTTLFQRIICQH